MTNQPAAPIPEPWTDAERIEVLITAVETTAAERDRLVVVLQAIANSFWTDGESPAEQVADLQEMARAALDEARQS